MREMVLIKWIINSCFQVKKLTMLLGSDSELRDVFYSPDCWFEMPKEALI